MVFHFLLWRMRSRGRNKKLWIGGMRDGEGLLARRHMEEHVLDVARLVEMLDALGEAFDMVF